MDMTTPEYRAFHHALKHIVAVPKKTVMRKIAAQHKRRKKKSRPSSR
jgi:hypothetical protein